MNETRPEGAPELTPRQVKLAAVLGLARFLREQKAVDLLELGVALQSFGECARRALAAGDLRAVTRLELAANLVRLVLREDLTLEECEKLEGNGRALLAAIHESAKDAGLDSLEDIEAARSLSDSGVGPFEIVLQTRPASQDPVVRMADVVTLEPGQPDLPGARAAAFPSRSPLGEDDE